ncbi:MAG: hypothetical protein H0W74_13500 [Sphingosinicella sp.]|nr:hypothetical protein [Sphingosinicella sp.]
MIETLIPVALPPGLFRNGTRLDAVGRWYNGQLMRWVEGYPQPLGGWREAQSSAGGPLGALTASATARFNAALAWRRNSGDQRLAIAGNESVYVFQGELVGGNSVNITPVSLAAGGMTSVMTGGIYGAGVYGAGPYGVGSGALTLVEAATWQLDNFGQLLVAVHSADRRLLIWGTDESAKLVVVAGAPIDNVGVVVTPERFLVALGASGNIRKVQWADQESSTVWTPSVSNQAGDFELQSTGRIRCGRRTKAQTLIWTDVDLHTMTYIGGDLIYSFAQAGDNCGIIGPNAVAMTDTQAFWMGKNTFYRYDGFVQPVPCEVQDYVFEDFNRLQTAQVWAKTTAEFGEVTWEYCSAGSTDPNRYVTFNYRANHWTFGALARTCGVDAGVYPRPVMVGVDKRLYEHEIAEDRGAEKPFLESGPVPIDKDRVMRIQRIVPDGTALGDAMMSIYTSMFPVENETLNGPYSLANPTDVRLTAKYVRLRIEEALGVSWRVGTPQLGVIPLGRR